MTPTTPPQLPGTLRAGPAERLRRLVRGLSRRVQARLWFPHFPLFLLIGVLGLLQLRHAESLGLAHRLAAPDLVALSKNALDSVIRGAPSATAGVFLVVMAFGLLTRSRLAWVIALLATAVSIVLIWLVWPGAPGAKTGLLGFNLFVLIALLASGRAFSRSSLATATLFAVASIALLVAYAVLGSYLLGAGFTPPVTNLVTAFYYAVVTMTTVGYGDIVPKTNEARFFAASVMILGITVFATSISALLVPLINRRMETLLGAREKTVSRSNHYVIAGDSSLARNTHKELVHRDHKVTFILQQMPQSGWEDRDVVIGDPSDLDVLRRADAHAARAVLALGNDDSENAFVVMAARELSEKLQTVAVVNDARNMDRVRRVRPDVVIAPQVLGGELLAMALSGETVDSALLMQRLLRVTD